MQDKTCKNECHGEFYVSEGEMYRAWEYGGHRSRVGRADYNNDNTEKKDECQMNWVMKNERLPRYPTGTGARID